MPTVVTGTPINLHHTGLPVQIADDVEGRGWGSPGGKPGEVVSIFLKAGLTLFFIHAATLELWFLTPSAAFLTVSIRSPVEISNTQKIMCAYTLHNYMHNKRNKVSEFLLTHSWFLYHQAILVDVMAIFQTQRKTDGILLTRYLVFVKLKITAKWKAS